jgi:hypothetical protein
MALDDTLTRAVRPCTLVKRFERKGSLANSVGCERRVGGRVFFSFHLNEEATMSRVEPMGQGEGKA